MKVQLNRITSLICSNQLFGNSEEKLRTSRQNNSTDNWIILEVAYSKIFYFVRIFERGNGVTGEKRIYQEEYILESSCGKIMW